MRFTLQLQLAEPGDPTADPTAAWPDERETVAAGTLELTALEEGRETGDDILVFDPTRVTDGIELSDDPLVSLRSQAYSVSVERRSGVGRPRGSLTLRRKDSTFATFQGPMGIRRGLGVALVVLAATPAAATAADVPAGAAWSEATIPSTDGVELHADILRPKKLAPGARTPVILSIGPYFGHAGQTGALGPVQGTSYDPVGPSTGPSDRFLDLIDGRSADGPRLHRS